MVCERGGRNADCSRWQADGASLQPPGDASQCKRMEEEDHTSAAGVWWGTSHRLLNGAVVLVPSGG